MCYLTIGLAIIVGIALIHWYMKVANTSMSKNFAAKMPTLPDARVLKFVRQDVTNLNPYFGGNLEALHNPVAQNYRRVVNAALTEYASRYPDKEAAKIFDEAGVSVWATLYLYNEHLAEEAGLTVH